MACDEILLYSKFNYDPWLYAPAHPLYPRSRPRSGPGPAPSPDPGPLVSLAPLGIFIVVRAQSKAQQVLARTHM